METSHVPVITEVIDKIDSEKQIKIIPKQTNCEDPYNAADLQDIIRTGKEIFTE